MSTSPNIEIDLTPELNEPVVRKGAQGKTKTIRDTAYTAVKQAGQVPSSGNCGNSSNVFVADTNTVTISYNFNF